MKKLSIVSGLYGNALEWYDFLLYASFAPVFADIFFPNDQKFISLVSTFSVFAIGFFMRPVGGAIIGHYADSAGRRKALIASITIMTLATMAIACLPNYRDIGLAAPLLFTLFRLVQGIAVGGELPGSATFLIEHMFAHRRGFAGSLVLSTAFLGIFIGSVVASSLSYIMSETDLANWGWRFAYLVGAGLGFIGIYLRFLSEETDSFKQAKKAATLPVKLVFSKYLKTLLVAILLTSIMAMGNYVLIAYVTSFLVKIEGFELRDALFINFSALLVLTLLIPIMGFISDFYDRKKLFLYGLIALLLFTLPIFYLLLTGNWWHALLSQLLLAIILAPLNATVPTMIVETFPTAVRTSGTAIGYNIGQAVFGGTLPLVTFTLLEVTGNMLAPAWYLFAWGSIVLICWLGATRQA